MTLSDWKAKGIYFNYTSQSIFTVDEGKGEVVLLIHGFPTSSWDWAQVWEPLRVHYRLVALDLLGFGFSDKPRNYPYSIVDQADLVEQFLFENGIARIKIMSHDYGDTVAQELLARYNTRIKSGQKGIEISHLCLLNGGLFPETHRPLFIQRLLMSPLGSLASSFFTRKKLAKNFKNIFGSYTQPSESQLDDYWALMELNGGKYVFHLLIRYMQERKTYRNRWLEALQESTIPIRLINGLADPISGEHMVKRYRQLIPNPDVVELPQIGHFPLVEAPIDVVKHFLAFVKIEA